MTLYGIQVPSADGKTWSWAIGADWRYAAWRKADSARAWLRRYADNWYRLGARVRPMPPDIANNANTDRKKRP